MDVGLSSEGQEVEEDSGVGGGIGERLVSANGDIASSVRVELEKESVMRLEEETERNAP
jgi:hypothetical protein